jgi:cytidylate kinase
LSKIVIAIDGPAGSGKSTVAKEVAKRLGLQFLDTGAMYRCIALRAKRSGLGPVAGDAIARLGEETMIEFGPGDPQTVLMDGADVTNAIRDPEIGNLASAISVHSSIRKLLVQQQKEVVAKGGVTLEGRDTTTVVAPHAQVKVFLTASIEERARRRHLELQQKGSKISLTQIAAEIKERDERDTTREDSPLKIGDDVTVIDTDGLSVEEVIEKVLELARKVE